MEDIMLIIFLFFLIFISASGGNDYGKKSIARDCEKTEHFEVNETVYVCNAVLNTDDLKKEIMKK